MSTHLIDLHAPYSLNTSPRPHLAGAAVGAPTPSVFIGINTKPDEYLLLCLPYTFPNSACRSYIHDYLYKTRFSADPACDVPLIV